jgi:hypothetical protein
MTIIEDLGRRLKGWPYLFIGPLVTGLLGYLFLRLKTVIIHDWIFLALIAGLWLAVLYVFWYIRHNEKKGESLTKMPEAPKPTKEILLVLELLAANVNGYSSRGTLLAKYDETYEEQEADEFAAVVGALHGSNLIRYSEPPINQEGVHLTDEGSKYYLKHKKGLKKSQP